MFELTDEETENLSRCKNFTLNVKGGRGSNIKYHPFVFTEQGIYMLMTVLRGNLAIRQSRALVSTFKRMKDYILDNQHLIGQREVMRLSMQRTCGIFHDRFIVLDYGTEDERVFLCGASSKDAGARITSIVEDFGIRKYNPIIKSLLTNPALVLP